MNENLRVRMEDLFMEADRLISDQKIGEAFSKLTGITQEMPTFGKAYNHLGWIYETKYKDFPNAEKFYKLAIENSPDYLAAYYNYAIVLSTLQKWDELTALLNKALTVAGINKSTIQNEFAIMYEAQGKYSEAIDAYKKYAAATFDNKQLDSAKDSIERCKKKMEIMG
ncbi:MAG: tetratricopeptide repeat protein [Chitinophagales bacterium]